MLIMTLHTAQKDTESSLSQAKHKWIFKTQAHFYIAREDRVIKEFERSSGSFNILKTAWPVTCAAICRVFLIFHFPSFALSYFFLLSRPRGPILSTVRHCPASWRYSKEQDQTSVPALVDLI